MNKCENCKSMKFQFDAIRALLTAYMFKNQLAEISGGLEDLPADLRIRCDFVITAKDERVTAICNFSK